MAIRRIDMVEHMCEYIRYMLDKVGGLKALILDGDTQCIISAVYTQSQILEKEVFLLQRIDQSTTNIHSSSSSMIYTSAGRSSEFGRFKHLNAVYFIRPSKSNFMLLFEELKCPAYNEYHFFFTAQVPLKLLEKLACMDEYEVTKQIHEIYADVICTNAELFTLNISSPFFIYPHSNDFYDYGTASTFLFKHNHHQCDEEVFHRIVDGILSVLLTLKIQPIIKFPKNSYTCSRIAHAILIKVNEEEKLFDYNLYCGQQNMHVICDSTASLSSSFKAELSANNECILLLFDRREDALTPLLNQWSYQAMLHELIGIENNRIRLKIHSDAEDVREIVVNPSQDSFLKENLTSNFGDLGFAVKKYMDIYQKQTKNKKGIESIEDMQKFVDEFPDFQKFSSNVSKHVTIVHELSKIVEEKKLLELSQIEQSIACSDNRKEHVKHLSQLFHRSDICNYEKLRLALIYSLRHEGDPIINQFKEMLRKSGIDEKGISLIDSIVQYGGEVVRTFDLFKTKNIFTFAKDTIQKGFSGTSNVYTQHKSLLYSILDNLVRGRLKGSLFETLVPNTLANNLRNGYSNVGSSQLQQSKVIVFVAGGVTFKEAFDVQLINSQQSVQVILGGTYIHNSKSFLTLVSQTY